MSEQRKAPGPRVGAGAPAPRPPTLPPGPIATTKTKRRSGPKSKSSPYVSSCRKLEQCASWQHVQVWRQRACTFVWLSTQPARSLLLQIGVTQYKRTGNWEAHIW